MMIYYFYVFRFCVICCFVECIEKSMLMCKFLSAAEALWCQIGGQCTSPKGHRSEESQGLGLGLAHAVIA